MFFLTKDVYQIILFQVEISGKKMSARKKTPFQKHREEEEAKKKV